MKRANPPTEKIKISNIIFDGPPKSLPSALEETMESFKKIGQITPVVVSKEFTPKKESYHLLVGETEVVAARRLGWGTVNAVVLDKERHVAIPEWIPVLKKLLANEMSDFDIAEAAAKLEDKWNIMGVVFAETTGLSKPYVYNLMRWYKHAPEEVQIAWKNQDPLVIQSELERYSHMPQAQALKEWRARIKIFQSQGAHRPGNGVSPEKKRSRRASVQKIAMLQESIEASDLNGPVKTLCCDIIHFILGSKNSVPGITTPVMLDASLYPLPSKTKSRPKTKKANA